MRFKLMDAAVSASVMLLLLSIVVGARRFADETENRIACASNLRQIWDAIRIYQSENKGMYPRTISDAQPSPVPVWGTPYEGNAKLGAADKADPFKGGSAPKPNDVTAPLFLLMRTQEIVSQNFVCPSTAARKFDFGGGANHAMHWTNWPGKDGIRKHLSYSYQNPYLSRVAADETRKRDKARTDVPLAADMNPGTAALLKISPNSNAEQIRAGNSLNHGREGQNVVYADGRVRFEQSPFVGADQDNMYTYGKIDADKSKGGEGIAGAPAFEGDSVLLPTAKDIGLTDGVVPVRPYRTSWQR
jgi:hypothetical protein